MAACAECGMVYTGAGAKCPRCARIDALMPGPLEPPPPVVIPGPPSSLSNTMSQTIQDRPADVERFASSRRCTICGATFRGLDCPSCEKATAPDTIECPRCAERIKARAKVCRFCGADFEGGSPVAKAVASHHVEVVRVEVPAPRRQRARYDPRLDNPGTALTWIAVLLACASLVIPLVALAAFVVAIIAIAKEGPMGVWPLVLSIFFPLIGIFVMPWIGIMVIGPHLVR